MKGWKINGGKALSASPTYLRDGVERLLQTITQSQNLGAGPNLLLLGDFLLINLANRVRVLMQMWERGSFPATAIVP